MLPPSDLHAIENSLSQLMLHIYVLKAQAHFLLIMLIIPLSSCLTSSADSLIKVLSEHPVRRDLLLSIFVFMFKVSEYPKLGSHWFSFSFLTFYSSTEKK